MKLVHHGALDGVTGSCHQYWFDSSRSVLIDCGTFQGNDAKPIPIPKSTFRLKGSKRFC